MILRKLIAVIALIWAIGISIASLIMPPMGAIDSSVLILVAQIIIFIATIFGIQLPEFFKNIKR